MHAPAHFRMDDQEAMAAFIEARHFGTLVVSGPNGPQAAYAPMLLNRDEDGRVVSLECHLSRSNPVAALAASGVRALAIFHGADAYVTPSFYLSKREHGKVVPTWNYVSVEVAGDAVAFEDAASLQAQIARMTDVMEQPFAAPWAVSDAPDDYVAKMVNGIIGLRVSIDSIEGVRKLSQNRSEGDRAGVLNGLTHSTDPSARQVAAEMTKEA